MLQSKLQFVAQQYESYVTAKNMLSAARRGGTKISNPSLFWGIMADYRKAKKDWNKAAPLQNEALLEYADNA